MPNLVGTGLNQVPTNSMLGGMAYQNAQNTSIENLNLKNISSINSEIAGTAVDVFVYDTSKDSDGGAWRKRTQHKSWYNIPYYEDEYIARGSRKDFPAVAVLVVDSSGLGIYDGDDPDLPLWMKFKTNNRGAIYATPSQGCVAAMNGIIFVGVNTGDNGSFLSEFGFIHDRMRLHQGASINQTRDTWVSGMVQKSDGSSWFSGQSSISISYGEELIDRKTNDVAVTVLPNSPIDEVSGLPRLTIVVATDGGVSVIKDDGTVVDMNEVSSNWSSNLVEFFNGKLIHNDHLTGSNNEDYLIVSEIPTSDTNYLGGGVIYNHATTPAINYSRTHDNTDLVSLDNNVFALGVVDSTDHLTLVSDETPQSQSMVAFATTSFNTGWMHGDCKGAFLSDTDTTNANADTLNSANTFDGTFASSTGWTTQASWSIGGGVATCNGGSGNALYTSTDRWSEGSSVVVVVTVSAYTSGTLNVSYATGSATAGTDMTATGTYTFVNNVSGNDLVYFISNSFVGSIDNVKIYYAEEDRSINNNGLAVYGTITKSAVATGADLVGYGGYTNANYLKQPYNSDLDFGTGDFSVTWWQYITGDISSAEYVIDRQGGSGNRWAIYYTDNDAGRLYFYMTDGSTSEIYAENIDNYKDRWACYTVTRSSSGHMAIYIDGKIGYQSGAFSPTNVTNTSAELFIGIRHSVNSGAATQAKYALMRFSKTIPSLEQIKKIYEDEKFLFQENAKATLYGSSDAVTALAFDEATNLLHVGTSAGRSDFNGLRRINNTTTAVTTAISAHDGSIAQQ